MEGRFSFCVGKKQGRLSEERTSTQWQGWSSQEVGWEECNREKMGRGWEKENQREGVKGRVALPNLRCCHQHAEQELTPSTFAVFPWRPQASSCYDHLITITHNTTIAHFTPMPERQDCFSSETVLYMLLSRSRFFQTDRAHPQGMGAAGALSLCPPAMSFDFHGEFHWNSRG